MTKLPTKTMALMAEKIDRGSYKAIRAAELDAGGWFEQVAYNRNVYGCTAKMWRGTATGRTVYTTDIYAVSL